MKTALGRIPDSALGWEHVSTIGAWLLFTRPSSNGWEQWKLCAKGRVGGRANFWMGFNPRNGQFNRLMTDLASLRKRHPTLHDKVAGIIVGRSGCDLL